MLVLISGGGIADPTLAYWLQQYAIPSVVIEQATALRRDGYAIDFLGTAYDVASRMGLDVPPGSADCRRSLHTSRVLKNGRSNGAHR